MNPEFSDSTFPASAGRAAGAGDCLIDLDAARRIGLRSATLGDPMSVRPTTVWSRMDALLEHDPVNRPIVLGSVLAEAARLDEVCARIFVEAGIAKQIRAEIDARKGGGLKKSPPLVNRPRQAEVSGV